MPLGSRMVCCVLALVVRDTMLFSHIYRSDGVEASNDLELYGCFSFVALLTGTILGFQTLGWWSFLYRVV